MEKKLMAGAYSIDITPPIGVNLVGSFGTVYSDSIDDPLYANAIVIDDGQKEIVMISADVCIFSTEAYLEIARRIEKSCGISEENVILTASHTHSAAGVGWRIFDFQPVSQNYIEVAYDKIVSAVIMG